MTDKVTPPPPGHQIPTGGTPQPEGKRALQRAMDTPTARAIEDSAVLLDELKAAFAALELWFRKYSSDSVTGEDRVIADCLFRDAIIRFIGCFNPDVDGHVPVSDVFGDVERGVEYFEWLKDIRDAYVAHTFGAMRQYIAGPFITDAGEVLGVGHSTLHTYVLDEEHKEPLLGLIRRAGTLLEARITKLTDQLSADVASRPKEWLAALPSAKTFALSQDEMGLSRSALQRKRKGLPTKKRRGPSWVRISP